jgi:hypothetical protein
MNVERHDGGTDPPDIVPFQSGSERSSRDVARRPLDQGGFRIINLGDPERAGDATKTDNRSIPKPASRSGNPGKSLLAAPADHSHPAAAQGMVEEVQISDPTEQASTGKQEQLVAEFMVNFEPIRSEFMNVKVGALVKVTSGRATFRMRLGGTAGEPDGKELLGFPADTRDFELTGLAQAGTFKTPSSFELVKITAATERSDATVHIRTKHIRFEGASDGSD